MQLTKTGSKLKVTVLPNIPKQKGFIKRLNKAEYVDTRTGEVKAYKASANRSESLNSIRRTITSMRNSIDSNFSGAKNEVMITLTYDDVTGRLLKPLQAVKSIEELEDNDTAKKRLNDDIRLFTRKLKRKYASDAKELKYLWCIQPHADGVMHYHMLLKLEGVKSFDPSKEELESLWGYGLIDVQSIENIDSVGAYLSAYLLNDDPDPDTGKSSHYQRLNYYIPGMRIYSGSRNLAKPEITRTTYKQLLAKVGETAPDYVSQTPTYIDSHGIQHMNYKAWYSIA